MQSQVMRQGVNIICLLPLLVLGLPVVLCQSDCDTVQVIGNNDNTEYTEATESMVYLNLNNPAQCNGTISSYQYCHYPTNQLTNGNLRFNTILAVFRRINDTYQPVNGSNVFVNIIVTLPFTCRNVNILTGSVQIQPGDVLGACVGRRQGNSSVRQPLNVVSAKDANGFSVLHGSSVEMCNSKNLQRLATPIVDLVNISGRILHLSAEFNSPTDSPSSGSSAAGVAVGVVFALLFVAAMVTVIVVIVVVLTKRGKLSFPVTREKNTSTNTPQDNGIENRIYGTRDVDTSYENFDSQHYEFSPENKEVAFFPKASAQTQANGGATAYAERNLLVASYEGMTFGGDVSPSPLDATKYAKLIEQNKEEDIYSNVDPFQAPGSDEDEIYSQLHSWGILNLSGSDVEITRHLGSGQFGSVEQGVWKRQGTKPVDVALKSLTKTSEEDRVKFLQEAAIMAQFKHPNVIMLYGVVAKETPMRLAVELAKNGDLRQFLLKMKPESKQGVKQSGTKTLPSGTDAMLLKFSQQVALGMQYLAGKGFVHRDLAARNVLVTANNVCKVADFGMSRDLEDQNYYVSHGGAIPVKWTAPEAIHFKKYSTASDVWAYGCLLYEIWSVGHKPFEGIRNVEVVQYIDSGKRLFPPPGTTKMVYELMILCWHPETKLRPNFRDVVVTLTGSKVNVLSIPEEDSSTHPLAGVLGAPLEAGENMYQQLQNRYIDYAARQETDQDYFEID